MGVFRKTSSIMSLGLVNFQSSKERTATNTARMAREARKQTRILREQTAVLTQSRPTPAGWYACPTDPYGSVRYWDGYQWTQGFKP